MAGGPSLFLLGVTPGMSSIFIGAQFIGFGLSSSLMMSWNSSSRGMVVVATALAFSKHLHCSTTVLGKPMGMRFSVSRSLKLISMSSSIAEVEIALMSVLSPEAFVQLILTVPATGILLPSATFRMGLTNLLVMIFFSEGNWCQS